MDIPEVRQCQDESSFLFGAVAVRSDLPGMAWGVFHPRNGGHWDQDDEVVKDWKPIQ